MKDKKQSRIERIEQEVQKALKSNLLDNTFASVALQDEETCQYVLRKITGINDLKVTSAKGQYRLLDLATKDSVLDVYAEDSSGRQMNLEIQRRDTVDHPRRTRYYSSGMDKSILEKGAEYYELPDVYVVYISETDIWNAGKTIYPVNKYLGDTGIPYDDGSHVIYANAEVNDGSDVANMLQYFKTADPNDMRFGALSKRIRFLKTEKGGREVMSDSMREFAEEMKQYGVEEGIKMNSQKTAKRLFAKHNSVEDIADTLEVDVEQVEAWLGLLEA